MDVFLMVRRKKTTIFLEAKETTSVRELKKMIAGITKVAPEDQVLYKGDHCMDDGWVLAQCGIDSSTAKPPSPAVLVLAFRDPLTGEFEPLEVTPYSRAF
ncbi:hypothetical protein HPB50_013308 [Hyalomma asiaticum]|uniref:Uncharacterized protein n=3 Tax=Hyalomma asiaticum TaxID=266040 RepID=A0ACB7TJZ0_HYAAI|nr:hypothetical protein HPB50_013070 [Hyalomma asiaticum]KAH6946361.1 hypothetical protein HPB50_013071 [Hyalomma asiaticum]KAH6946416.1 hypothetical protein HPB50_013308 [Hyalomma asiaticum]